jgi:hypothetical protein
LNQFGATDHITSLADTTTRIHVGINEKAELRHAIVCDNAAEFKVINGTHDGLAESGSATTTLVSTRFFLFSLCVLSILHLWCRRICCPSRLRFDIIFFFLAKSRINLVQGGSAAMNAI